MLRIALTTAALGLCVWVAMAGQAATQPVTRLFSDAQGETHTETVMMDVGRSNGFSPTAAYFSQFAADMNLDWHPAPRRQLIIMLSGAGFEVDHMGLTHVRGQRGDFIDVSGPLNGLTS